MANTEERWIERETGQKNYFKIWKPEMPPKGIVLIISGMMEHVRRYDHFARYLCKEGYLVAAGDHRGQGQTALRNGKLGTLGKDGFNKTVQDQKYYVEMLRKVHPKLPIYILGHSFGSIVSQKFIQQYSEYIDGLILIGSAKFSRTQARLSKIFLKVLMTITGEYYNSKLANKLAFYNYNKGFENDLSPYAWLNSDMEGVRKYEKDALCGYLVSNNFLYEISEGMSQLYNPEQLRQIRKDLPILILAGAADPLNANGKLITNLFLMYRKLGIKNVTMRIYDKMRHEILMEKDKLEVYHKITDFLKETQN